MELIKRIKAPTPKFWRKVRNTCGTVAAIAGLVLTAPVSLPATAITALTYIAVVAGTIAGTAQITKEDEPGSAK